MRQGETGKERKGGRKQDDREMRYSAGKRERDRRTDGRTDGRIDRQTDRQTRGKRERRDERGMLRVLVMFAHVSGSSVCRGRRLSWTISAQRLDSESVYPK